MLIRVVRMVFQPEKVTAFLEVFNGSKDQIRGFEGCRHMELLQDFNDPHIFMTYSYWESETHLNNYRKSELFGQVWPATKKLFAAPPVAFSARQFPDALVAETLQKS
ncbi:antibiotic biosynthesis monooxygenase [Adhaeribacter sp. BT258]|uniref:Antibiotic biosynthesis monooxygenase n=1 Tax=Adhaeribacter terrigena TaxID=2793070 RepID=A0ABS1BYF6_9BACT|nr:antibiotic biosynthesis monooxygenase family protein [Adhaeribacter terrigena]MBK0402176.1 antibiotic biosynthesis monooxygenase [Adhaeribacter terrigena]